MDIILQVAEAFKPDFIDYTLASVISLMAGAFWVFFKKQWKDLKENGERMATALVLSSKAVEDNNDWMKSVDARLETNKDVALEAKNILNVIAQKLE